MTIDPARTGRRGRAGRRRGQGPGDVGPVDPRGAPRGQGEPGRGGRARRLQPGPRAGGHRPVRCPCRRRLLRRSIRRDPDPATLEAALRLARLLAIASLRDVEAEIDVEAIRAALAGVRAELDALKGIKATLTSIATSAAGVQLSPRPAARRRRRPGRRGRGGDPRRARRRAASDGVRPHRRSGVVLSGLVRLGLVGHPAMGPPGPWFASSVRTRLTGYAAPPGREGLRWPTLGTGPAGEP